MEQTGVVHVIDDDLSARRSLEQQLELHGFSARTYSSIAEFEQAGAATSQGCLILHSEKPVPSGLAALERLRATNTTLGIVLISGHVGVEATVHAMRLGAVDVLVTPCSEAALLDAIQRAMQASAVSLIQRTELLTFRQRVDRLTPREREVGELVARGLINRQIAATLGTSIKTVKVHRGRVMKKLEVTSVVDLVRVLDRVER
jgi:FixJ family two-component response regulator